MPYPQGADLADFLVAAEVIDSAPGDLDEYDEIMLAASQEFEKLTGWAPFLNEGDESDADDRETRYFDPNGTNVLVLDGGILAIESLTVNDVEKTQDTHFWLQPHNKLPFRMVEFSSAVTGKPKTIAIDALWGYTATLPELVKRALLARGATEVGARGVAEARKIKQGPIEIDRTGGMSLGDTWRDQWQRAIDKYRRTRVF